MKYGKLNIGQMEALANKLGGMSVVEAILAKSDKLVPSGVENLRRIAFLQSFDKCHAIRDLLHGWGDYSHEDGITMFHLAASLASERAINLAEKALRNNCEMDKAITAEAIKQVDLALIKLTEFRIRDGEGFDIAQGNLEEMKGALLEGNKFSALRCGHYLKGFLRGVETMNVLILAPVEKVTE